MSVLEEKVEELLLLNDIDYIRNCKTLISPLEVDFYIPKYNLAIELNGVKYHTEKYHRDKYYHLNKTIQCSKRGIKLLQFFDYEVMEKTEVVDSIILSNCNIVNRVIPAKKCEIERIKRNEAEWFYNINHIEGYCKSRYHLGLIYQGELISMLSYKKSRKFRGVEITRYCNTLYTSTIGGYSRLTNQIYEKTIKVEVDRRIFDGKAVQYSGFTRVDFTEPVAYIVYNNRILGEWSSMEKVKKNLRQNMDYKKKYCFDKLWDCGRSVYVKEMVH